MKRKWVLFLLVFVFAVELTERTSSDDLASPQPGSQGMVRKPDLPDSEPAQSPLSGISQTSPAAVTPCECPIDPRISALCIACEGDLQEAQRLLKLIPTPNVTANGTSPLCIAANYRRPEIVQALLDAKADPNYRPLIADGLYGRTPLLCAAGCDPSASFQSCEAVVNVLVSAGADINKGNSDGYTPLMAASSVGNLAMVMLLIRHGADINAATRSKRTALDYARDNGHPSIVTGLLEHGVRE